jgi:hypothetical protein
MQLQPTISSLIIYLTSTAVCKSSNQQWSTHLVRTVTKNNIVKGSFLFLTGQARTQYIS